MKTVSRPAVVVTAFLASLVLVVGVAGPASAAPPVPLINMDCTKLASATNPAATFDTPVEQRYAPAQDEIYRDYGGIPFADEIRMAGGLVCQWSDGLKLDGTATTSGTGVRVEYLPNAESGYDRWATFLGGPVTPDSWIFENNSGQYMSSAGGDWLKVVVDGAHSEADGENLAMRIRDALQLGHTTTYTAPTYATPMKPTCGTTVRPSVWRAAVGATSPVVYFNAPPGYDTVTYAMNQTRAFFCAADDLGGTGNAGLLQDLPGGRWSFLILQPILTTPGPLTAISVPGMRAGDTAFTRCDAAHRHCILDALIATHWIQVDLLPATMGGTLIRNDRLNAMTPLLTEIVQQVYTP